jgi:N-methylhydantoinase A
MIAFGGAAPLHAARLCEKLGISRCLVPNGAGVGSAIGFLCAPFSFEANRSVFMPMRSFEPEAIKQLFADMQDEATKFVRSCDNTAQIDLEYKIYMRYAGQGWEIPIPLEASDAANPDAKRFLARFEEDYKRLFGRIVQGMEAEITVWSVNAFTPTTPPNRAEAPKTVKRIETSQTRACFDPALGQAVEAQIIERDALEMGMGVEGPALIIEDETTIVLPASRSASVASDGTIEIRAKGRPAQP